AKVRPGASLDVEFVDGIHAGDAFHFIDARGHRSGYATVGSVDQEGAHLNLLDTGAGRSVIEAEPFPSARLALLLGATWRIAYQRPKRANVALEQSNANSPELGRALEVGGSARDYRWFAPSKPWLWLWEIGASALVGDF